MADPAVRLPPLPFEEAIAWARARRVVLPAVYFDQLRGLARAQAFTVTGLAELDQIQAVADSLAAVLETGESFTTWQQRVRDGEILLDATPARLETIFRNALQQAYNRGRYEQQAAHTESHPYYLYDAVGDDRTRPSHAAMDGLVARWDDPVWDVWTPACGHRCRCKRVALTERQATPYREADAERQRTDSLARIARSNAAPDPGWEHNVYIDPNAGLRQSLARRRAGGGLADRPEVAERLDGLLRQLEGGVEGGGSGTP